MHGGKRKGAGKPKGSVDKKKRDWKDFGEKLFSEQNLDRMLSILKNSSDEDFMKYLNTLIEYFQPKISRSEVTQHTTIESQTFKIGDQEVKF